MKRDKYKKMQAGGNRRRQASLTRASLAKRKTAEPIRPVAPTISPEALEHAAASESSKTFNPSS